MRVGVLGAGAVGAYVGCLIHARCPDDDVILVGRRALDERSANGVILETVGRCHPRVEIPRDHLRVTRDAAALAGCDVVLVAVKSTATADAAAQLARCSLPPDVVILSLQNGVGNAPTIAHALARDHPSATILPCVVNMNVVWEGYADEDARVMTLRRCTPPKWGIPCVAVADPSVEYPDDDPERRRRRVAAVNAAVATLRARGATRVALNAKVREALHSKLLVNLLSPINALARETVPKTLANRAGRLCWRALILEALDAYAAAGIRTRAPYVPILPSLLNLPDWAYAPLERALFPLDPGCKSSMLQDVESGRPTEMDAFGAEVVRLAASNATRGERGIRTAAKGGRGTVAPRNAAVAALVRKLERGEIPGGRVPPEEVLVVIERAAAEANERDETKSRD